MHHPDSAGDSGSVRKMAHPAIFPRRGSNTGSGSGSTLSTPANSVVNNSHVPVDDYQSSLLIQSQPPVGSSSAGPQHPPPHSLNLLSQPQPQPTPSAGAQMKKKSGFQITSVTPAQISVSTNNSIAEDTESYDDLDESHTEDLSSSEILDVSLSRANDIAGAERSSSEETLNNFHEAETPGAISPNQPSHPHSLTQTPQHGGTMVNGTMHHHYQQHHPGQHQHHHHQAQVHAVSSGTGGVPSALTSGALHCVTQKMPSNVGVIQENVSAGPPNIVAQPVGSIPPGSVPGMNSSATGTTVGLVNPQTSNVSNVNMLSSANVPVRGGIGTSASSGSGGFPPSVISSSAGSGVGGVVMGGNLIINPNANMIQQHQVNSSIIMTTTTTTITATTAAATVASTAASASGLMGLSGTQGGVGASLTQPVVAPAMAPAPVPSTLPQAAPAPATATTSSRFRVVKLDSSSEPFKKGRWTCTEYYDKETPSSVTSSSTSETACPSMRPGESMRQFVPESFTGGSERESTSGSSVSSTVSTLSHYTESVGSGEAGGPQQSQDYASPPQGFQAPLSSGLNLSHTQPHMHPQDITHAHLKTTVASSAPTSIHQPIPMTGHQTTIGHSAPGVPQQQLTYAQAVAAQPSGSTQGLVGVQHQQMSYTPLTQQPSASQHAAPVQVRPPEYTQSHQGLQPATSQPLSHQAGSAPAGPGNGAGQMMGGPQQQQSVGSMPAQQQQVLLQTQPRQTSALQAPTSTMVHQMGVAGLGQQQQPQSIPTQAQNQAPAVHPSQVAASSVPPPNPQSDPQPQAHNRANSVGMAPQSVPQVQPTRASLAQDFTSAQAQAHAAQASALYASLPTFTTTQLEDAQRLLLQHQSTLLGLPKLAGGETGFGASTVQGQGAEGNAAAVSALTTSAGLLKSIDGEEDGSSGASVVAIDNKIEQAMDLVKSHLMYAVREEVEVLKEQIKELIERNSQLEQENTLLKTLASPEQMAQFQAQVQTGSPPAPTATAGPQSTTAPAQLVSHNSGSSA
ncbi:TSC22 domain family protein 1 [Polymixia lowei]